MIRRRWRGDKTTNSLELFLRCFSFIKIYEYHYKTITIMSLVNENIRSFTGLVKWVWLVSIFLIVMDVAFLKFGVVEVSLKCRLIKIISNGCVY